MKGLNPIILLLLPLTTISSSDKGIIIFGGEGPEGPLDTVSVLTQSGWCPQDNVLIPPLPMAASALSAFHGIAVSNSGDRPYLLVCGFPGDHACYSFSLSVGEWTPVLAEDEVDMDLSELEFIHIFENHKAGGATALWRVKETGKYVTLWCPGYRHEDGENMIGWLNDYEVDLDESALGDDPAKTCMRQPVLTDGYPLMVTISGGFKDGQSLDQMLIMESGSWKNNSIGLKEARSEHSCLKYKMMGIDGFLVAGGFSVRPDLDEPITWETMEFFYADEDDHSEYTHVFTGTAQMRQPRSNFGLADWGEEGLVAVGGRVYGESLTDYELLDSVEIWDTDEDIWTLRDEWKMPQARAGFATLTKGYMSAQVVGADYCSSA